MENRITVTICEESYTLIAEEAPSHLQRIAAYVDEKMGELLDNARVNRTNAAVLTAVNVADELFKERDAAEQLRRQLKEYDGEIQRMKNELSELRRENFRLQNKK